MNPTVERLLSAVEKLDAEIVCLHPRTHRDRLIVLAGRRVHIADQLDRLGITVSKPGIPARNRHISKVS